MIYFRNKKKNKVESAYSVRIDGEYAYVKFSERGEEYHYLLNNIEFVNGNEYTKSSTRIKPTMPKPRMPVPPMPHPPIPDILKINLDKKYNEVIALQETISKKVQELCHIYHIYELLDKYKEFNIEAEQQINVYKNIMKGFNNGLNVSYKEQSLKYANDSLDFVKNIQDNFINVLNYYDSNKEAYREKYVYENSRKEEKSKKEENIDTSLFDGCDNFESLTKRYRVLMKTYHPDNPNGDKRMTIKIKNTYNKLKAKYV